MAAKTDYVQLRTSPAEKRALQELAERGGQSLSAWVLDTLLGPAGRQFGELTACLAETEQTHYELAAIHDLVAGLPEAQLQRLPAPSSALTPRLLNHIAALCEQRAEQLGVPPPVWVKSIESLPEPWFATSLVSLRLHLLVNAPPAFRRRGLFVDTGLGGRC